MGRRVGLGSRRHGGRNETKLTLSETWTTKAKHGRTGDTILLSHPLCINPQGMVDLGHDDVDKLAVNELKACSRKRLKLPSRVLARKDDLVAHIVEHAPDEVRLAIWQALEKKHPHQYRAGKRRNDEEHTPVPARNPPHLSDQHDANRYLDLPTAAEVKAVYRQFFEATSNDAVRRVVCAVCARECRRKQDGVETIRLLDIPNAHRLKPETPHPAHELFNGALLAPEGVSVDDESQETRVNICSSCREELRKDSTFPPQFSLANGLWIGPIPDEIKTLSFLEQLIIAHTRTKCYVFKLWPKAGGSGMDASTMQRAMRGNVTSYDLNVPGV